MAAVRTLRDREAMEAGFECGLMDVPYEGPHLSKLGFAAFLRGEEIGQKLREEVGDLIEPAVKYAAELQQRAVDVHRHVEKFCEERGMYAPRLEPCASCKWIGLCGATSRTCSVFRCYVSPRRGDGARVPDRLWDRSWGED